MSRPAQKRAFGVAEVLPEKSLAERHLPGGDGDPGGEKVTGLKGPNQ